MHHLVQGVGAGAGAAGGTGGEGGAGPGAMTYFDGLLKELLPRKRDGRGRRDTSWRMKFKV